MDLVGLDGIDDVRAGSPIGCQLIAQASMPVNRPSVSSLPWQQNGPHPPGATFSFYLPALRPSRLAASHAALSGDPPPTPPVRLAYP